MPENALKIVREYALAGAAARERFFAEGSGRVVEAAMLMAASVARNGKILFCGNGGSAADSQHLAAEFVNRFMMERPPLPAIALSTDTSILTAIGNDYSFEQIFSKQVQALGRPGDVLVGISTSGSSPNVLRALEAARAGGLKTIGLAGRDGGAMRELCDIIMVVENAPTPAVQETHIAIGHLLCRLCDYFLFENVQAIIKTD